MDPFNRGSASGFSCQMESNAEASFGGQTSVQRVYCWPTFYLLMTWEPSAAFNSLGTKGVPDASGVTVPGFSVGERWGIVSAASPPATTDPSLPLKGQTQVFNC